MISLNLLQAMLEEELPGVYVHSIMIGSSIIVDTESGFFRDTNRQITEVIQYNRYFRKFTYHMSTSEVRKYNR
jgi:hypothetical protein